MSDSVSGVAKIVMFLGAIMLLTGLVYPESTASWDSLEATLASGPQVPQNPTAGDPYVLSEKTILLTPVADGSLGPYSTTDSASVPNCDTQFPWTAGDYFGCVNTDDGSGSYVSVSPACCSNPYEFSVNLSTFTLDLATNEHTDLISVNVTYSCKAEGTDPGGASFNFFLSNGAHTQQGTGCVYISGANDFRTFLATGSYRNGLEVTPWDITDFSGSELTVQVANEIVADISSLSVSVTYMIERFDKSVTCSSGDVACTLNQAWAWVADFWAFIVGGAIFVGQTIYAYVAYFLGVVGGFLFGIIGSFAFFFAIPGMPPILQGGLDVILVSCIGYVVLVILRLFRGGG